MALHCQRLLRSTIGAVAVSHVAESLGIGGEPLIKRLLGHSDNSVTSIYNRYGYLKEMRAALEAWARELTR